MCTLSWIRSRRGYLILFNRDERRARPNAFPPRQLTIASVGALAPIDAAAGGTWIGVNRLGVTLALLNRYDDAPVDPTAGTVSRGILLRSLLDAGSAELALRRVERGSLTAYQPFTIAAFDRGTRARFADWNGRTLERSAVETGGLLRTSSGRNQLEADRQRTAVFAAMAAGAAPSADLLLRFHQSHLPERGPFSPCMHREEAETRSLAMVRVSRRRATMRYWDGPPCTRPVVTQRILRLTVGR